MGKGGVIKYGDILIEGDAPLSEIEATLARVLKKHGYPPSKVKAGSEFEEELAAIDSAIEETDEKTAWSIRGVPDGDEDRAGDDV